MCGPGRCNRGSSETTDIVPEEGYLLNASSVKSVNEALSLFNL